MNRKGFIFTVFIILFLSSVLLSILAYVEWYDSFVDHSVSGVLLGNTQGYMYDDLSQDILAIQDIVSVNIIHSGQNVTVRFSGGYNSSQDYGSLLSSYASFVTGLYAQRTQYPFVVDQGVYGWKIPLYGVSTSYDSNDFYIYTQNYSLLQQVNITLLVANTSAFVSSSAPSSSGNTLVHVRMIDPEGREFYNGESFLNPSSDNSAFTSSFSAGTLEVYFQNYGSRPGTLWFDSDYNVSILALDLVFIELNRTLSVQMNTSVTIETSPFSVQTRALAIEG